MTPRFTPRSQLSIYDDVGHTHPTPQHDGAGHDPTHDPTHPTPPHPTFPPLFKEGERVGSGTIKDPEALRAEITNRLSSAMTETSRLRQARAAQRRQFDERRMIGKNSPAAQSRRLHALRRRQR